MFLDVDPPSDRLAQAPPRIVRQGAGGIIPIEKLNPNPAEDAVSR